LPPVRSPREWLDILSHRLDARWGELRVFDAYYEGDQTLAYVTRKFRDAYGGLFSELTDNWMPLVVDSSVERLRVQGYRFGEAQDADDDAWRIWQANGLDAESNMVHTESVKLGWAYWLVQPNGDVPRVTAEHPSQVIVANAPGDRRTRLAALRKWVDDDGFIYANVYLPDRVYKYRTTARNLQVYSAERDAAKRWETLRAVRNPLGVVPVVPVPNNPSMLRGGRSDLAGGPTRIQDAVNMLLASMLIGAEYQAYPQRVLLGVDAPRDENGNIIKNAELTASQKRLWMFPNADAKAFEFKAADLDNFRTAIDGLVRDLTAQTRTPPHYVAGQIVNASGDALKAAETGLVSKVRDKMDPFGEAHEEMMRLAFRAIDARDERAGAVNAEVIWRDPESRSQAEVVDAVTKQVAIGLPFEVGLEKMGYSPQEIDRILAIKEAERFLEPSVTDAGEPAVASGN
jgi:hypothetical protein